MGNKRKPIPSSRKGFAEGLRKGVLPPLLYRCILNGLRGNRLEAGFDCEVNGRRANYLFAATCLSKALAFAFDYSTREILANGGIEGTTSEFALICDRSKTLGAPRRIQVLSFSSAGFEEAWPGTDSRQAVSTESLPVEKTNVVLETTDVKDLMRHGLQLFSTDRTLEQLTKDGVPAYFTRGMDARALLQELLRNEGFYWENLRENIDPDAMLLQRLGLPPVADGISPKAL